MLAFWTALAVMCSAVAIYILVMMPWRGLWDSLLALGIGAGAIFGAVLGRQMAFAVAPEHFASHQDLAILQSGVLVIALVLFIVSWVCNLIYRVC